eukprot:578754-Rhodomonas_salina.2
MQTSVRAVARSTERARNVGLVLHVEPVAADHVLPPESPANQRMCHDGEMQRRLTWIETLSSLKSTPASLRAYLVHE